MNIIVSQLPFPGCMISQMAAIPSEYGIEVFIEYGNDFFWKHSLKEVLEGRTGRFSVHGPFVHTNLASPATDWEGVVESYKWAYEFCRKYNASHCVIHPNAALPGNISRHDAQKLSLERVAFLSQIAISNGIEVLVENMPHREQLFNQQEFVSLFSQLDTVNFLIDTGHALITQWNIQKLIEDLNLRIKAYHIHDNPGTEDCHLKVGDGIMDWASFFKAVKDHSPDASLVLEYYQGSTGEILDSIDTVKGYLL